VERAIGCFHAALRIFTEVDFPIRWAATQNNLGLAYGDLGSGSANLERALYGQVSSQDALMNAEVAVNALLK